MTTTERITGAGGDGNVDGAEESDAPTGKAGTDVYIGDSQAAGGRETTIGIP